MNSKDSGSMSERFFEGKGLYIVLFLCAAVIGMSVWAMNAGSETVYEDAAFVSAIDEPVRDTVVVTVPERFLPEETEEAAQSEDELTEALYPEGATAQEAAAVFLWPAAGEVERSFSVQSLAYDATMADWRTHSAVDISCEEGSTVSACHAGTVESVYNDSLLGTVMVINHGEGLKSVYANLNEDTNFGAGTWVAAGTALGSVGSSAIGESGQGSHLHFAMYRDGNAVNPMEYLAD